MKKQILTLLILSISICLYAQQNTTTEMNLFNKIFKTKTTTPTDKYEEFWNWFVKNEKKFFKIINENDDIPNKFFSKLDPKLEKVHDNIFFLCGMYDDNTAELILTPDGIVNTIVFIEKLVSKAPKLDNWKFTALKQASKETNISIYGYDFSDENISFYERPEAEYPDELNLVFVHDDYKEEEHKEFLKGLYIFLDNYLGEYKTIAEIDNIYIEPKLANENTLIHLSKLDSFLTYREKEFIEKYDGERHNTEDDTYVAYELNLPNGNHGICTFNSELLAWDRKASHPWMMVIELHYKNGRNGMPNDKSYQELNDFEDKIMKSLKDNEGYLNIGRETLNDTRRIYFACKEFRKPSKILYNLINEYPQFDGTCEIYKDKYWRTLSRYIK